MTQLEYDQEKIILSLKEEVKLLKEKLATETYTHNLGEVTLRNLDALDSSEHLYNVSCESTDLDKGGALILSLQLKGDGETYFELNLERTILGNLHEAIENLQRQVESLQ